MNDEVTAFLLKKIGKMIGSEDGGDQYNLPELYAPKLLDSGFIELRRWSERTKTMIVSFSAYFTTPKGREAYKEWKNG